MRVGEDRFRRSEKTEQREDTADVSALRTSRVKLSVAERASASFAETVIAVAVDRAFRTDLSYRFFARVRLFAPLDDYRRDTVFKQAECAEQSCGAGTDDDDASCSVGTLPFGDGLFELHVGRFADIDFAAET